MRQIRAFIAVARCGSFTRAALQLHLSQPALTVQIRQIESALGVKLFDRNTRAVRLTRLGRELLPKLERLQLDFEAIIADSKGLAGGHRGVVRLACLPSVAASVLPAAVKSFNKMFPHVNFHLKDVSWHRVVAMVRSDEVDFGIGDIIPTEPGLDFIEIFEDKMQVIYPARHPIDRLSNVSLRTLSQYPLVMMDSETSARSMIDAAFAAAGCQIIRACEVMYVSTAAAMVQAGLGIAILPASSPEWRAYQGLKAKPIRESAFIRPVGIIKKSGQTLPPVSAAFAESLKTKAS